MSGMDVDADLLAALRKAVRTSEMGYRRIGKRAGISHVTIIRFMRGNGLQTYTLTRLARVLGYTVTLVATPVSRETLDGVTLVKSDGPELPAPTASARLSARGVSSPVLPQPDQSETCPA